MTGPRYTRGDRVAILALFLVYVGLVVWACIMPGEGAPVAAVHSGRLG